MKQCPNCRETYSDDSLNFCLNDGTPLTTASVGGEQATAVFPSGSVPPAPTAQVNYTPTQMAGAGTTAASSMAPPKKKSKAWIWVLAILGAVVLLCGGGLAGLIYVGSQVDTTTTANFSFPTPEKPSTPSTPAAPGSSPTTTKTGSYDLSLAQYNQIKEGTTRAEAEKILGGPGKVLSDMKVMGTTYTTIQWEGEEFTSVILSFKDDKVTFHSQVGLK